MKIELAEVVREFEEFGITFLAGQILMGEFSPVGMSDSMFIFPVTVKDREFKTEHISVYMSDKKLIPVLENMVV